MDLKSLKERIKEKTGLSDKSLTYIILAVCAVLLLIIINGLDSGQDKKTEPKLPESSVMQENDFCTELKKQLEEIVSEIDGVGKVKIMITVSGTSTQEYQTDIEKNSDQEKKKTVVLGNKEALVKGTLNPQIEGVLVVCDGGGNIRVQEKVINAVSTVLNISSSKVYVTNRIKER